MKAIVVVSRYPYSPHFHLEGQEYGTKKEAEQMIEVFKARTEALDKVQKKFGLDTSVASEKSYFVAEVIIPDSFYQENAPKRDVLEG